MARFKYLGEPAKSWLKTQGPLQEIRIPKKDGSSLVLTPVPPKTSFPIGEDIGYDITDDRALRCLRADTRYSEIV